jgi:P2 family phage contractile tail tube protein
MIDYKGLGMAGTAELWAGVEKLESKIKWSSFDAETLTMSASPFQTHSFQARGNLEQYTSQGRTAELPVVYLMTGIFKDAGSPTFRQHQMVETTSVVSIYHCELFVAGFQIYLYDVFANIYVVGGVDQLSNFRSNLGG